MSYSAFNARLVDEPVKLATPKAVPYAFWKRLLDIVGASTLVVVTFPLFVIIAVGVKLTSRGPIFYRSGRVGLAGKRIVFVKFRTMCADADQQLDSLLEKNEKDGPIFKIKQDPRVTPFGRFLRKYSLDELPQVFTVLKGDMSLVGPRPPLEREVELYDERSMRRLCVKPGITCFWQVMGRSDLSFEEWVDLDLKYIDEMNFWLDLRLMVRTPVAVIRGKGAY